MKAKKLTPHRTNLTKWKGKSNKKKAFETYSEENEMEQEISSDGQSDTEDDLQQMHSNDESNESDELNSNDDSESNMLVEEDSSEDEEILKKVVPTKSDDDSTDDEWLNDDIEHKKSLNNLKKIDPEFYQFLEENDKKLLDFNASDDSEDEDEEKYHVPPEKLEIGSDESDYEDDDVKRSKGAVTLAFVKTRRENLINNPSVESIRDAVELFHAALDRVSGEETSQYTVEGSAVFNAVMETCVMHLHKAVVDFLKLPAQHAKDPSKSKKWVKIKSLLQSYFVDLFKILEGVASEHISSVLLKHLHSLCCYVACFKKISISTIKHLTKLWSTGEESVRVLAFLCILRLTTIFQKSSLLNKALKMMYISFIRGSKFVSANTLPQINFMKQSLVTLFAVNPSLAYQHAFLYIRQLAIHLRNAITLHNKETYQAVYNWQYIHSLRLWVDLMCSCKDSSELRELLYPLIQIILGCLRLVPTAQYLPLRFHCIQMLIKIENELNTYVPVIPLILESLNYVSLNKRLKKASMKPFDFTFVLRLSKAAMTETGFTDAVVENVFEKLLEVCVCHSHSITYPDLVVPAIIQLKSFTKECKVPKYNSKLKQVLTKIEENYKFVNNERNKLNINLRETDKINAFELDIKAKGTPLQKYWQQYKKSQNLIKGKRVAHENAKLCDAGLPKIKKTRIEKKEMKKGKNGQVELFPSDESDSELSDQFDSARGRKDKKKIKQELITDIKSESESEELDDIKSEEESEIDEPDDVVEELNISNF